MKERDLDNAMERLRQKKLPDCPPNLEQNVWRKTRIRRKNPENGLFDWMSWSMFEFGWAIPILLVTVLISSTVSTITLSKELDQSRTASKALDFDFISQAQSLSPFAHIGEKH